MTRLETLLSSASFVLSATQLPFYELNNSVSTTSAEDYQILNSTNSIISFGDNNKGFFRKLFRRIFPTRSNTANQTNTRRNLIDSTNRQRPRDGGAPETQQDIPPPFCSVRANVAALSNSASPNGESFSQLLTSVEQRSTPGIRSTQIGETTTPLPPMEDPPSYEEVMNMAGPSRLRSAGVRAEEVEPYRPETPPPPYSALKRMVKTTRTSPAADVERNLLRQERAPERTRVVRHENSATSLHATGPSRLTTAGRTASSSLQRRSTRDVGTTTLDQVEIDVELGRPGPSAAFPRFRRPISRESVSRRSLVGDEEERTPMQWEDIYEEARRLGLPSLADFALRNIRK